MKESTPYYAKPKLLTHDRLPDKQTELAVRQPYLLLNRQWPLGQMEKKKKRKKDGFWRFAISRTSLSNELALI